MKTWLRFGAFSLFSLLAACGSSGSSSAGKGGTAGSSGGATSGGGSGGIGSSGGTTATGGAGAGGTAGGTDGGDGTCRASTDCGSASFCAAYTLPPLCGGQIDNTFVNDCQTDAECADAGSNYICDNKLCDFPHGGAQTPLHCRKGCSQDVDCGPGLACDASHCVAKVCGGPTECGTDNFTCDSFKCAPKPCSSDADCADFCVNGTCSATIGQCQGLVP